MHESDEKLVSAYQSEGSGEAMTELILRYTNPIYNLLVRLVNDRLEAEDLTQETFMKMWKGLEKFDIEKNFKTWLFAMARNSAIDYLRKKRPTLFSHMNTETDVPFEENISDEELLPDALFEKREAEGKLEAALEILSLDERTIIVLHESDELSFEEISTVLNKPMNTVKSQYRRALIKLRNHFLMHQK